MNYVTEIEINAPVEKVAGLMGDHEVMLKWMQELKSYQLLQGKPRYAGTKTLLHLNAGYDIEVMETIIEVDFPTLFIAKYEMEHGSLKVKNNLQQSGSDRTMYIMEHAFEFKGMLKLAAAVMKPAFVKHSERMMESFKIIAEKE